MSTLALNCQGQIFLSLPGYCPSILLYFNPSEFQPFQRGKHRHFALPKLSQLRDTTVLPATILVLNGLRPDEPGKPQSRHLIIPECERSCGLVRMAAMGPMQRS